jgi:ABC-type dipeptide/oligopeptide/nickel transport system ATPase component
MSALAVLGLVPQPGRIAGGRVRIEDRDLLDLPEDRIGLIRGREIAMIFQEPMTSLNPVLSIGVQLREGMRRHLEPGPDRGRHGGRNRSGEPEPVSGRSVSRRHGDA